MPEYVDHLSTAWAERLYEECHAEISLGRAVAMAQLPSDWWFGLVVWIGGLDWRFGGSPFTLYQNQGFKSQTNSGLPEWQASPTGQK